MSNSKIIISIILVFIISFTSFVVFAHTFPGGLEGSEKQFFSKEFTNKKKIILMGSSHVGQLNTTEINYRLLKDGYNYEIFNLAYNGDKPSRRLHIIDDIIELNPSLVIYGISYRDFRTQINENPLPDPQYFSHKIFSNIMYQDVGTNPKLITLNFFRDSQKDPFLNKLISFSNTPFFTYNIDTQINLMDELELEKIKNSDATSLNLEDSERNAEYQNLIQILNRLKNNHIKVVIFLTPLHKHYIEQIPKPSLQVFDTIVDNIERQTNVPVYDLRNKYNDKQIWANLSHVAYNEKSLIYTHDISKIIQDELDR